MPHGGGTQRVSEGKLAKMRGLIKEGKLWLQVTRCGYRSDKELMRTCPNGRNVETESGVAFFRPVEKSDIDYILRHNETGSNWGYAFFYNHFFLKDGDNFKAWHGSCSTRKTKEGQSRGSIVTDVISSLVKY